MSPAKQIYHLLFLCVLGLAQSTHATPLKLRQSVTVTDFQLTDGDSLDGVSGVRIAFDLKMKYRGAQLLGDAESSLPYDVIAYLIDATDIAVPAAPDASDYQNASGEFRDSLRISLSKTRNDFKGRSMFLPYYALGLLPGQRRLRIRLVVVDGRNGETVGDWESESFFLAMPPVKRFRLDLKGIIVSDKDPRQDSWDYYFLNKREILPDVRWTIFRGKKILFRSERQKNTTVYEGDPEKDRTGWFSLAEGDRIDFYVHDFDLITFSDVIGDTTLSPWTSAGSEVQELAFGQVTRARFVLQGLEEPKLKLTRFEVQEGHREAGVTGIRVRFNYALDYDILGIRFLVKLNERFGEEVRVPRFARVIAGPVALREGATFELTGNEGAVTLFLPHYGLDPDPKRAVLLRLSGEWQLDGQQFDLMHRDRELLDKARPVQDLVFGQWKGEEVIRGGIAGLRFTAQYELADRYLTELDSASVRLFPRMETQNGPVPPGYLQHIAPENAQWENDALRITSEVDTAALELFFPYYMLPTDLPNLQLKLAYTAILAWEGREVPLGEFKLEQQMSIPPRMKMKLRVAAVGAKKERRIFSDPGLEWRVYLGNTEKYRSRTIPHAKSTVAWRPDEAVDLLLSEKDLIRIEVYRIPGNGDPFRIGVWEGTSVDFPEARKGLRTLEVEGLKKLSVVIE
ncbi:MAG: hypothetical protein AAGN35_04630 [Bacteroidota bacterium]